MYRYIKTCTYCNLYMYIAIWYVYQPLITHLRYFSWRRFRNLRCPSYPLNKSRGARPTTVLGASFSPGHQTLKRFVFVLTHTPYAATRICWVINPQSLQSMTTWSEKQRCIPMALLDKASERHDREFAKEKSTPVLLRGITSIKFPESYEPSDGLLSHSCRLSKGPKGRTHLPIPQSTEFGPTPAGYTTNPPRNPSKTVVAGVKISPRGRQGLLNQINM